MSLVQITPPDSEPLSVGETKHYLRVDSTDDDMLIEGLIVAARQYAENKTKRVYVTTTLEYSLDEFPVGRVIQLPAPPVISVSSLKYYATDGTLTTFSATNYNVDVDSEPARIVLKDGQSWPSVEDRENAVVITYVAGYGDPQDVPSVVKSAMLLLIGHWYEHRCGVVTGTITAKLPMGVDALLATNSFGWYA